LNITGIGYIKINPNDPPTEFFSRRKEGWSVEFNTLGARWGSSAEVKERV
jgi:hypothetical protein